MMISPLAAVLTAVAAVLMAPAVAAVVYYWVLALVAFLPRSVKRGDGPTKARVFAIVIPAHDEAAGIGLTLRSCAALDYPLEKFRVWVIADNCTDATAAVAAGLGARVLERTDLERRGKGQALEWAFARLAEEAADAYFVLDADCLVQPDTLTVLNAYLDQGWAAVQANNLVSNPDDGAISYSLAVGNLIENQLFYAPKSRLGWAVFLRGTGMAISRELLLQLPWRAGSVTEDVEYSLDILRVGLPVAFAEEAEVRSPFPANPEQLAVQRWRWAGGNASLGRKEAFSLVVEGLERRKMVLVDAGWTLLVLSRPLVLTELFLAVLFAAAAFLLRPGPLTSVLVVAGIGSAVAQALYLLSGVVLLGITGRRLRFLLGAPGVVLRLVGTGLRSLFSAGKQEWARTPRA